MAQGSTRVQEVQKRLRSAATHLEARRFDEALGEVDAALAIDPGSLAAQALRTRIETVQIAAAGELEAAGRFEEADPGDLVDADPVDAGGMAGDTESLPAVAIEPGRFVPPGVNAASWIGFEHRIQERRFGALLDTVRRAVASGDGIGARVAFEEARELRPDAPELGMLADQVARLPMAMSVAPADRVVWSRAAGGVLLLMVGVGLLLGVERVDREARVVDPPGASPAFTVPEPVHSSERLPAPVASMPAGSEAAGALVQGTGGSEAAVETNARTEPDAPVMQASLPGPATGPAPARAAAPSQPAAPTGDRPAAGSSPAVPLPAPPDPPQARTPPVSPEADRPPARATASAAVAEALVEERLPSTPPSSPAEPAATSRPAETTSDVVLASRSPSGGAVERPSLAAVSEPVRVEADPVRADAPVDVPAERAVVAAASSSIAAAVVPHAESDVEQVINRYARGYSQLDASGVREVWPSAPERALARAFAELESQAIRFESCDIAVDGTRASASCQGSHSFVVLVGSRERRTEPRQWRFDLRRDGDAWKIHDAQIQRR